MVILSRRPKNDKLQPFFLNASSLNDDEEYGIDTSKTEKASAAESSGKCTHGESEKIKRVEDQIPYPLAIFAIIFLYNFDTFGPFMTPYMKKATSIEFVNEQLLLYRMTGCALTTLFAGSLAAKCGFKFIFTVQIGSLLAALGLMRFWPTREVLIVASVLRGAAWGGNICIETLPVFYYKTKKVTDIELYTSLSSAISSIGSAYVSQLLFEYCNDMNRLIDCSMISLALAFAVGVVCLFPKDIAAKQFSETDFAKIRWVAENEKKKSSIESFPRNKPGIPNGPNNKGCCHVFACPEPDITDSSASDENRCKKCLDFSCPEEGTKWHGGKTAYYAILIFGIGCGIMIPLSETFIASLWDAINPNNPKNGAVDSVSRLLSFAGTQVTVACLLWFGNCRFIFMLLAVIGCGLLNLSMSSIMNLYTSYYLYFGFSLTKRICKYGLSKYIQAGITKDNKTLTAALQGKFNSVGLLVAIGVQILLRKVFFPAMGTDKSIIWMYKILGYMYLGLAGILVLLGLFFYNDFKKIEPLLGESITKKDESTKDPLKASIAKEEGEEEEEGGRADSCCSALDRDNGALLCPQCIAEKARGGLTGKPVTTKVEPPKPDGTVSPTAASLKGADTSKTAGEATAGSASN